MGIPGGRCSGSKGGKGGLGSRSLSMESREQYLKRVKKQDACQVAESSDKCHWKKERDLLLDMTQTLDEHPPDYNGPCECKECRSYGD